MIHMSCCLSDIMEIARQAPAGLMMYNLPL
jgi:hypothetical protein